MQPSPAETLQRPVAISSRTVRERTVGSLLIQERLVDDDGIGDLRVLAAEFVLLGVLPDGDLNLGGGKRSPCRMGDLLIANPAEHLRIVSTEARSILFGIVPRRLLWSLLPMRLDAMVLPRSPAVALITRYLSELLALPAELGDDQARLAVRALLQLVAGALVGMPATDPVPTRGEASLLDRAIAAIDADVAAEHDARMLCDRLGCSRSALYRAVAAVGGVSQLVTSRRLAAAHHMLCDPRERRTTGEVAHSTGFDDVASFTRRFKRAFGVTPGEHRRRASTLADPDSP